MNGMGMNAKDHHWRPLEVINSNDSCFRYALVVLNRPIRAETEEMLSLWNRASVRVLVDGGSDRWFSFCGGEDVGVAPDLITGDLDSATPGVLAHYRECGVKIVLTPDQNETDFTKSLRQVQEWLKVRNMEVDAVIALAETSGRLDQIVGNINTLHKVDKILGQVPVYILSRDSLTWLLAPGAHRIAVGERLVRLGIWCALMPIGAPAHHVTTTGLKWNLVDQELKFGGMVSTSNSYGTQPFVTVQTDDCLLWSMGLGRRRILSATSLDGI